MAERLSDQYQATKKAARLMPATAFSRDRAPGRSPRFQASIGPTPKATTSGIISGMKVALK